MATKNNIAQFPVKNNQDAIIRIEKLLKKIHETMMIPAEDRPLMRVEAARYLGIHPDTLYRLARENKIAYIRLGDGDRQPMRFLKKDLDAYLAECRIAASN